MKTSINIILLLICISCKNTSNTEFDLDKYKLLRLRNQDSFLLVSNDLLSNSNLLPLDKAKVFTQLGHYHYDKAELDSAYLYYQQAFSIRKVNGDSQGLLNSKASMADILSEKELYDSAIRFYLETISKRDNKNNLCDDYNNLAGLYSNKEINDSASFFFHKAIELAREINDSYRISRSYYNLSLLSSNVGEFDSALYYLNESSKIDEYALVPDNQIKFLLAKAEILYYKLEYSNAFFLYDSVLSLSIINDLKNQRLFALEGLASIAEIQNKLKEANYYLKWKNSLSDTLFNENIQNSIANLQVKYDTQRKTLENMSLYKENLNQKKMLVLLTSGILLLLVALVFIYKNQQNKRKKTIAETNLSINKILDDVNQTKMEAWADGQEKERTRLAGELHDRLGGLLVMASHHFTGIEKKFDVIKKENEETFSDFRKIINTAIIEVRELSKDISSNLVSKLGLANAMIDLKEKIEMATGLKVNLSIHDSEGKISLSSEIALFRVAQEALNNVMKHAQASKVELSLTGNENSLVLMIEDDGRGFDVSKNSDLSGIGLKSMLKRMQDIGGTLNIDSSVGRGTVVVAEVTFRTK